jgi:hypothetical protein
MSLAGCDRISSWSGIMYGFPSSFGLCGCDAGICEHSPLREVLEPQKGCYLLIAWIKSVLWLLRTKSDQKSVRANRITIKGTQSLQPPFSLSH